MPDPNARTAPNRRDLLLGAGLAVGAVPAPATADHPAPAAGPAKPFNFANNPPRKRKSFADLSDDELRTFCAAVGYMRNGSADKPLTLDNPVQWDQFVMVHAHHCTEAGQFQVHWSWFFLPWHRAYLYFMERHLANIVTAVLKKDGDTFALPYWDWENVREVPNTRARAAQGKPSPFFGYDLSLDALSEPLPFDNLALWDGYRGPTLEKPKLAPESEAGPVWGNYVKQILQHTSPEYLTSILRLPWPEFGGDEVISRDDGQGMLEQYPHNMMHDWVGSRHGSNRDMGTLRYAALDPMFYMHHGNLDRLWSLYPYTPKPATKPAWANQAFTFTDVDGKPVSVTVADVIKHMSVVTYAAPEAPSPAGKAMLEAVAALPKEPPKPVSEPLLEKAVAVAGAPVTAPVPAAKPAAQALLARGAGKKPVPAVLEFAVGPLAYLGRLSVRVFVNKPDATAATETTDKHYIGQIAAMDSHAGHRAGGEKASHKFRLPVTRGDSSFFDLVTPGEAFDLTLVPVGSKQALSHLKLTVKSVTLKLFE